MTHSEPDHLIYTLACLIREVRGLNKSRLIAPLNGSQDNAVSRCRSFMDQTFRPPVDESAEIVRWNKVARLMRALADGTYDVSAQDVAEKIIRHVMP